MTIKPKTCKPMLIIFKTCAKYCLKIQNFTYQKASFEHSIFKIFPAPGGGWPPTPLQTTPPNAYGICAPLQSGLRPVLFIIYWNNWNNFGLLTGIILILWCGNPAQLFEGFNIRKVQCASAHFLVKSRVKNSIQ